MKSTICAAHQKQTVFFKTAVWMIAIVPLWLMNAMANTSAYGQTSDESSKPTASTTPSPADWTEFHRDNMQRWNPYETVLDVGNVGSLQVKWKRPIGLYDLYPATSPAVVKGVIYFGSHDNNVYALNASTGTLLWSFTTGGPVYSSPAVVNGVVYVGSCDSKVYALNASTGAKLWSHTTPIAEGQSCVASAPTVVNGVVYVGSADSSVYALSASNGTELWRFSTGEGVVASPAVAGGMVYVGSTNGYMYGANASTGTLIWKFLTGPGKYGEINGIVSSPSVVDGKVYFGGGDNVVYALSAGTGTLIWRYGTGFYVNSSPAVADGVVYITSGDGYIHALSASSGAELWYFLINPAGYLTGLTASPVIANGVVYLGVPATNDVYALDAKSGTSLWTYSNSNFTPGDPVVVDGVIYCTGEEANKNYVYAFSVGADLHLRIGTTPTTVHQGDLITYAFSIWNLGPDNADQEVLTTQVPEGTTFDYIRISGTPGLGTCTTPAYGGTGLIVCHENSAMAPNTTWTVRLTVKVAAPADSVITEDATVTQDTTDPNSANNTATVSTTVQ
jgi:uncharacterized repeat protein (TIGR01451 family)